MTRLDALRGLLSKPREKDMERIGRRVINATYEAPKPKQKCVTVADWLKRYGHRRSA